MRCASINMLNFDAILFDLGSTLIYFDGSWPEVIAQSEQRLIQNLHAIGYAVNKDEFITSYRERMSAYHNERKTAFIEHSTEHILRLLLQEHGYCEVPLKHLHIVLDAVYRVSEAHWHTEVDAVPMLQALQNQGYHLGLISNASYARDVEHLIDQSDLRQYFEVILISASIGICKPHPHIFQMALDHWEIKPDQAVMVGDTLEADIQGANNIGMVSVWITRRVNDFVPGLYPNDIHPDAKISTLEELPNLLEVLNIKTK